jgi:hypothetical protein
MEYLTISFKKKNKFFKSKKIKKLKKKKKVKLVNKF